MGYTQVEPDESGRKRARLTAEGAAFLAANRAAADDLLARKPPAFHRGNAPKEIVAAIHQHIGTRHFAFARGLNVENRPL